MLLPFFQWMQELGFSAYFLNSVWPTPIVQCIHLLAVAVFAGPVLVLDLRRLARGLTWASIPQLSRSAPPWLVVSLAVAALTGIPQLAATSRQE